MKILKCFIIDDEIDAIKRMESLLSKLEGVSVLANALKAEIAISEVVKSKPDIVFVDIEMPQKTGFEVIKAIRDKNFYPHFIIVSAYNQYAIEAIRNAAFDFLVKPVKLNELKNAVDRLRKESNYPQIIDLKNCSICEDLSDREKEVLLLSIEGNRTLEIAEKLFITKATVNFHRKNILDKTGYKNFNKLIYHLNKNEFIS